MGPVIIASCLTADRIGPVPGGWTNPSCRRPKLCVLHGQLVCVDTESKAGDVKGSATSNVYVCVCVCCGTLVGHVCGPLQHPGATSSGW